MSPETERLAAMNAGIWYLCWLTIVGVLLAAWWDHHVWIAASLSFVAAFMLVSRKTLVRRADLDEIAGGDYR